MAYTLSKDTLALLEDLERRIDPDTEIDYERQWRDFLYGRFEGDIFIPTRKKTSRQTAVFEPVRNINDAVSDYDRMLRHQLQDVSAALSGTLRSPCIRANYGTGIMTSLFGAEIFHMPRQTNTLPTTRAVQDTDHIRAIVEKGLPDLHAGFGKDVFAFGALCAETFEHYPKVKRFVRVYHPDLQGPLDLCELLWGSEFFYAMYDEPELVHALLRLITDTYIAFMDRWLALFPPDAEMNPHWSTLYHRGTILLRDDSAMNLSPQLYRDFAAPYDAELLQRYGGAVHFCGRGDHYIDILCAVPGLYGINMSQPHLNDMERIYQHTVDQGIPLLGFDRQTAAAHASRAGAFHHNLSAILV